MLQIPSRRFSGYKRNCGRVINLPADQHEARPLGNAKHVAPAHFNVRRSSRPFIDVGSNLNDKSSCGRLAVKAGENLLLLLLDQLILRRLIGRADVRREAGRLRGGLNLWINSTRLFSSSSRT